LSTYFSGGANAGCMVLDKTITGVSLTQGEGSSSSLISGSSVTVHPVEVTGDPGLNFVTNFSTTAGTAFATISFTINAPSSNPMTDASLAVTGTLITPPNADFGVEPETLSNGKSLNATNGALTDSTTFAATTSLIVTDQLAIGRAELTSFENQFSETPVPVPVPKPSPLASLALLGIGLSALGLAERRKRA
jgi:hypothetical protein